MSDAKTLTVIHNDFENEDRFESFADGLGGGAVFGPFLSPKKGHWYLDKVLTGVQTETYVAFPETLASEWVRWEDRRVTKRYFYPLGTKMPKREELGETDESAWPTDDKGRPKDPWAPTYYLGVEIVSTGERVMIQTGSVGGKQMLQKFARQYGRLRRRFPGQLPVLRLGSGSYVDDDYGPTAYPTAEIIAWVPHGAAPALEPEPRRPVVPAPSTERASKPADRVEDIIDDEVPPLPPLPPLSAYEEAR